MESDSTAASTHSSGPEFSGTLSGTIAELENPPDDTSSPHPGLHEKTSLPRLVKDTVLETRAWGIYSNMMIPFWGGYQSCVATFGFQFCNLHDNDWWVPGPTPMASTPYATRCQHDGSAQPLRLHLMPRFGYARDMRQQDLFVKLIDKGTAEDEIYRYLAGCKALYDSSTFPCVLPPTAIIGSPYKFAFAVMPMWGSRFCLTEYTSLREIFTFIRCTVTGLSFLHDHRIVHRDIHEVNVLVNWYCLDGNQDSCSERMRAHYRSPSALYALFDFDMALKLPSSTSLKDCRRPAEESYGGHPEYHPSDVYQGERHYNPFAFDVACLGNLFLRYFVEAIPAMPLLAVLFSRMTTHVVDDRFTAAEALAFFRELEANLSPDVLDRSVTLKADYDALDDPEVYWSRLSPEDATKWQSQRPPPLTWPYRFLRWLNSTRLGWDALPFVRRTLRI